MEDLRLDALPGVGPVTTKKLSDAGIHHIMDLIVRGPVDWQKLLVWIKTQHPTL